MQHTSVFGTVRGEQWCLSHSMKYEEVMNTEWPTQLE